MGATIADGNLLARTSAPALGNLTIMAWFLPTSWNPDNAGTLININDAGSGHWVALQADTARAFQYADSDSASDAGTAMATGSWLHIALVHETGYGFRGYFNGVADVTMESALSFTPTYIFFGGNAGSAYINGTIAAVKIWTAALTLQEIAAELRTVLPRRLEDLESFYPMLAGEYLMDYGGGGHTLTAYSTVTDGSNPPLSWGAEVLAVLPYIAGGTTYYSTPAGELTSAGAIARAIASAKAGVLTPAGTVNRLTTGGTKAGALTPDGALARMAGKLPLGTLTSSGEIVRATGKPVAGALTESGTVARAMSKPVAGALTPAGTPTKATTKGTFTGELTSSGALDIIKTFLRTLTGAFTSSGAIVRQVGKGIAGVLTPMGTAARATTKSIFAGGLAPSGALSAINTFLRIVTGALTSSGTVARQVGKGIAGALGPSGTVAQAISKTLAGALTLAGSLATSTTVIVAAMVALVVGSRTFSFVVAARDRALTLLSRVLGFTVEDR